MLRYRSENSDRAPELICFQAKSFDDLAKKSYMQELKAQRDDSFRKVLGIHYYFLLLCTDSKHTSIEYAIFWLSFEALIGLSDQTDLLYQS